MKKILFFGLSALLSLQVHGKDLAVIQNDTDYDQVDVKIPEGFRKSDGSEGKHPLTITSTPFTSKKFPAKTEFYPESRKFQIYVTKSVKGATQNTNKGEPLILNQEQRNSLLDNPDKNYLSIQSDPSQKQLVIRLVTKK